MKQQRYKSVDSVYVIMTISMAASALFIKGMEDQGSGHPW